MMQKELSVSAPFAESCLSVSSLGPSVGNLCGKSHLKLKFTSNSISRSGSGLVNPKIYGTCSKF